MDRSHQICVPFRPGGKKIRKRRELDALIAHSVAKKMSIPRTVLNINSKEKLLSASTDDAEDYTWVQMNTQKNTHSICTNRCHNRKYILCKHLLVLITIAVVIGLLYWMHLDLRQEMFDYRQKIEEVANMIKDLPDILQKWHEVSTLLRNNQTTTIIRLNELERTTEKLRLNFTKDKWTLDRQQNFAKEKKMIAAFGAKIEAVITDMESFKHYYSGVVNKQTEIQTNLNDLSAKLMDAHARTVNLSESSISFSKEISVIKLYLRNDSTRVPDLWLELSQNLSLRWTALHQNVQRNEMFKIHNISKKPFSQLSRPYYFAQAKLNSLHKVINNYETTQNIFSLIAVLCFFDIPASKKLQISELMRHVENISLHITLVENNWKTYNIKIKDCQGLSHNTESNVTDLKTNSEILTQSLTTICRHCTQNNLQEKTDEKYKQNATVSQKTQKVIGMYILK